MEIEMLSHAICIEQPLVIFKIVTTKLKKKPSFFFNNIVNINTFKLIFMKNYLY